MKLRPLLLCAMIGPVGACNGTNFSGDSATKGLPPIAEPAPEPTIEAPAPEPTLSADPTPVSTPEAVVAPTPAPSPEVTQAVCKKDVTRGVHIVMVVDNSGSMGTTDCPQMVKEDLKSVCQGQTSRETAVLGLFDRLQIIRAESPADSESLSSISISNFSPAVVGDDSFAASIEALEVGAELRPQVETAITFARRPIGDTPYRNAVAAAKQALDKIDATFGKDGKKRLVILVTDGEPTDRDPKAVETLAVDVKSRASWFTLMVTSGQIKAERFAAHRATMERYELTFGPRLGGTWRAAAYETFDSYMTDVLALSTKISDRVIEVKGAEDLDAVITKEVVQKEIQCKP